MQDTAKRLAITALALGSILTATAPIAANPLVQSATDTGHTATEPQSQSFQIRPVPEGAGTGTTGMRWTAPESWVAERPSSSMRRAQYRVPGQEEGRDAEAIVFYFGPGQGGDAESNAARWIAQFSDPSGGPTEHSEKRELRVGDMEIVRVEVRGTYDGGMLMRRGGPTSFPDYMLLGAIAKGPDANWFFKLTGPEPTVQQHKKAFDELLASLSVDSE